MERAFRPERAETGMAGETSDIFGACQELIWSLVWVP